MLNSLELFKKYRSLDKELDGRSFLRNIFVISQFGKKYFLEEKIRAIEVEIREIKKAIENINNSEDLKEEVKDKRIIDFKNHIIGLEEFINFLRNDKELDLRNIKYSGIDNILREFNLEGFFDGNSAVGDCDIQMKEIKDLIRLLKQRREENAA